MANLTSFKSKIGYGLGIEEMRKLGLYVSEPRPNEVDYIFPEPGLFLINPKGRLHIIEISNAPFIRPDINLILRGINHIQKISIRYGVRNEIFLRYSDIRFR